MTLADFTFMLPLVQGCTGGTDYDVVSYFPWTLDEYMNFSESRGIDWKNSNILGMWYSTVTKWTGVAAICGRNSRENVVCPASRLRESLLTPRFVNDRYDSSEQPLRGHCSFSIKLKSRSGQKTYGSGVN